jgi:hypothetical protein
MMYARHRSWQNIKHILFCTKRRNLKPSLFSFKKPKFYKILSAILVVLVLLLLIVVIILSVLCKFKNVSLSDFPINPNTRHSRLQYILRESDMHFRRVPSLCGKSAFVVGLQRQPLRRLLQIHLRTLVQRTP